MRSKLFKGIAMVLCAVMLAVPVADSYTLTAQASDLPFAGVAGDYLEKLIDMALSKAGVVAEEAIIDKVKDDYITFLLNTGDGYLNYLKDNGIDDVNVDTWKSYVNQSDLAQWQKDFALSCPEVAVYYYERYQDNIDGLIISEEEALNALGIPDATYGKQYTLPSVAVNFMRNLFKSREAEYAPYYMISTFSPDTIPSNIFKSSSDYSNFKKVLGESGDAIFILMYNKNSDGSLAYGTIYRYNNTHISLVGKYVNNNVYITDSLTVYNSSWTAGNQMYEGDFTFTTLESFKSNLSNGNFSNYPLYQPNYITTSGWNQYNICTSDGRNVPLFSSLDALKAYDTGQAPYYTTKTYNNWDSSTDNSITYTGDYLIDNSSERSYTTINSSEDYSQSNIDNSVTNITNNYIYTNPNPPGEDEGSGDDGGSDSGLTLGDALNTWVTAIKEFITFALNLLGEAVALISGFLNDALTILTGLTDSFSGFTGLLAGMFSFLPQEVIDALSAGIILIIVLGVIKGLKG